MAVMLDTDVLVNAIDGMTMGERANAECRAATHVLFDNDVRVSSVTVFELLNIRDVSGVRDFFARKSLPALEVSRPVALLGSEVLKKWLKRGTFCEKCFGLNPPSVCKLCGAQSSKQRKTNDALILATASLHPEIKVLYTEDGGMMHAAQFVENVEVRKPPRLPPETRELFENS